jgi:hypothetical protein
VLHRWLAGAGPATGQGGMDAVLGWNLALSHPVILTIA